MDNATEPNAIENPEGQPSEGQSLEGQSGGNEPGDGQAELESLENQQPRGEHGHSHGEHAHAEGPPPMDPACKREISVEIPAEVVTRQQEALVQQYSKQARIPGFRKGKVPASMVRSKFASEITSDVVEALVPQYFKEAVLKGGYQARLSTSYIWTGIHAGRADPL